MLINQLTASEGADVKQALSNTFLEVDASLSSSRIDCEFSGSTAVVSLLKVRPRFCLHLVWATIGPGPRTLLTLSAQLHERPLSCF